VAADPDKAEPAAPPEAVPAAPLVPRPGKPTGPRTPEQIQQEISNEREQLTRSLSDLREGIQDARRIPLIVGGALVAGIAAVVAVKAVRGRD
jgi:hypothetical protein